MAPTVASGSKASGLAQSMPSETQPELHGSACTSMSATIPRARSRPSIACRWLSPPVTKPSGEIPYSSGDVPPRGASAIQ